MKTFCHSGCTQSRRADRECGLIYGQIRVLLDEHRYIDVPWHAGSVVYLIW
jgi:hypothetical protein